MSVEDIEGAENSSDNEMTGSKATERLFSYGTLQLEAVQLSTFGRILTGAPDILNGYAISMLKIENKEVVATSGEAYHPIITHTANPSDFVPGTVFNVTPKELRHADEYEVADYKRLLVTLSSGTPAWVYVKAE